MLASFADDLSACLRLYSRLPAPGRAGCAAPDFRVCVRALPLAGTIIGACGGAVLLAARLAGVPPLPAAALGVLALVVVTGALHEDGLADMADGFGGGATRDEKLEIMRDSRLGSYGGAALVLSLLLRVAALAAINERSAMEAVAVLAAAGALSRTAGLAPLLLLPPARADGLGSAALRPFGRALWAACALALLVSLLPLGAGASPAQAVTAAALAIIAAAGVAKLAERQIGGLTGDVLGAAQQAAEIAVLLAFSS